MRILFVADEPTLGQSVLPYLRNAGFDADFTLNVDEGLAMAKRSHYDAVILDLLQETRDGTSILKELRHSIKDTPLLMLSVHDSMQDSVNYLDSGADDCLVKPFHMRELEARLRALIRRASIKPNSIMEIGPVVIDTTAKVVTVTDNRVPLTKKEYQLLELLAENRGNIVTRSRIYERLFNECDHSLANLVDVYVSNIRRKVGHVLIKTFRGQGYMIEEANAPPK